MKPLPLLAFGLISSFALFLSVPSAQAGHYHRHHGYGHGYGGNGLSFSFNFAPQPRYVVPVRPVYVTNRNVVTDVQAALVRRGYNIGGVDGIAGQRTRAALADFQHASGLNPTGEINEATLRALRLI